MKKSMFDEKKSEFGMEKSLEADNPVGMVKEVMEYIDQRVSFIASASTERKLPGDLYAVFVNTINPKRLPKGALVRIRSLKRDLEEAERLDQKAMGNGQRILYPAALYDRYIDLMLSCIDVAKITADIDFWELVLEVSRETSNMFSDKILAERLEGSDNAGFDLFYANNAAGNMEDGFEPEGEEEKKQGEK